MIFVDSNVWIDLLNLRPTLQAMRLEQWIGRKQLCTGDLVLTEVLQGLRDTRAFNEAHRLLRTVPTVTVVDVDIAVTAARHYRHLRGLGITIRQTIDTLIATRCIQDGLPLLSRDRDFAPFVEHLGLRDAMAEA